MAFIRAEPRRIANTRNTQEFIKNNGSVQQINLLNCFIKQRQAAIDAYTNYVIGRTFNQNEELINHRTVAQRDCSQFVRRTAAKIIEDEKRMMRTTIRDFLNNHGLESSATLTEEQNSLLVAELTENNCINCCTFYVGNEPVCWISVESSLSLVE
jgi:hypothetical protein